MVGLESLTDSGAEISHADEPRRRRVVHRRFLNSSSVVVVVFVELSTPSTKTSFHLNRKRHRRHRRQRLFVSDNCFDAESSKDFFCAIATEETEAASLGRLNRGLSLAEAVDADADADGSAAAQLTNRLTFSCKDEDAGIKRES